MSVLLTVVPGGLRKEPGRTPRLGEHGPQQGHRQRPGWPLPEEPTAKDVDMGCAEEALAGCPRLRVGLGLADPEGQRGPALGCTRGACHLNCPGGTCVPCLVALMVALRGPHRGAVPAVPECRLGSDPCSFSHSLLPLDGVLAPRRGGADAVPRARHLQLLGPADERGPGHPVRGGPGSSLRTEGAGCLPEAARGASCAP